MNISTDEPKVNTPLAALSENHLNEMHDFLTLALDATEGNNISYQSVADARSLIRSAVRIIDGVSNDSFH